ncbi:hypothetical protein ACQ4PT_050536 [Festuca glaucescens]
MSTAGKPNDVVLFAGVSLKLGTVCRHLLRSTRVPYTIALLILGIALGSLGANINPDLLLAAFLPALLFESAFSMDAHQIKLFYRMVLGRSFNAGSIMIFLSEVSLGAVALGLVFGIISLLWLGCIFNDTILEMTLTLAVSYLAFYTACAGAMRAFCTHHGTSLGFLLLLYVFVQMTRVVVVGVCYPLLGYFGYGLDFKDATVLVWSRLRGVVSLSQAMSVKRASDAAQPLLKPEVGTMFLFFTGGIVFLTLILNGSTTQFLLHILGMDKLSATKLRMLNYTRHEMLNKALDAFGDLRDDEELGPADWVIVKKYITCLSNLEDGRVHPDADKHDHIYTMNLTDIRVCLLNGLKKLKRNPPLVKMPSVSDLLGTHPLIGVLPAVVRAPLLHNIKETVKGHDTALYMEGSRATGIWIVSTGLVKWATQRLSSMYSLDPILSYGSTLGLYEVLTGKYYICDMITVSLVRCFFIEAEKVDQLRRSDPSVEALLWQVCFNTTV